MERRFTRLSSYKVEARPDNFKRRLSVLKSNVNKEVHDIQPLREADDNLPLLNSSNHGPKNNSPTIKIRNHRLNSFQIRNVPPSQIKSIYEESLRQAIASSLARLEVKGGFNVNVNNIHEQTAFFVTVLLESDKLRNLIATQNGKKRSRSIDGIDFIKETKKLVEFGVQANLEPEDVRAKVQMQREELKRVMEAISRECETKHKLQEECRVFEEWLLSRSKEKAALDQSCSRLEEQFYRLEERRKGICTFTEGLDENVIRALVQKKVSMQTCMSLLFQELMMLPSGDSIFTDQKRVLSTRSSIELLVNDIHHSLAMDLSESGKRYSKTVASNLSTILRTYNDMVESLTNQLRAKNQKAKKFHDTVFEWTDENTRKQQTLQRCLRQLDSVQLAVIEISAKQYHETVEEARLAITGIADKMTRIKKIISIIHEII